MRRALLLAVLALGACRTAPEERRAPAPAPASRKPAPARPQTEAEFMAELQAREKRIADWDASVQLTVERDRATTFKQCYLAEVERVENEAVKGTYRMGNSVPRLAGNLVLVVAVEPSGRVVSPRIEEDTLRNENVARCLLARVREYRFEPSPIDETLEIKVPLRFELMGGGTP